MSWLGGLFSVYVPWRTLLVLQGQKLFFLKKNNNFYYLTFEIRKYPRTRVTLNLSIVAVGNIKVTVVESRIIRCSQSKKETEMQQSEFEHFLSVCLIFLWIKGSLVKSSRIKWLSRHQHDNTKYWLWIRVRQDTIVSFRYSNYLEKIARRNSIWLKVSIWWYVNSTSYKSVSKKKKRIPCSVHATLELSIFALISLLVGPYGKRTVPIMGNSNTVARVNTAYLQQIDPCFRSRRALARISWAW